MRSAGLGEERSPNNEESTTQQYLLSIYQPDCDRGSVTVTYAGRTEFFNEMPWWQRGVTGCWATASGVAFFNTWLAPTVWI